ncbi:MAG: aminotransferase class III-fold pyridoxal phosphate-dependent enzyme, partial [Solirubrobacteraceae bacterium]
ARATREAGGLVVADEVQAGHGRMGEHLWSFVQYGLAPDVVTLGKSLGGGVPVGAYGMTAELRDHLERHRDAHGRVAGIATGGTTYANPLSLAATVATLTRIQTPEAFERTAALGAQLADGIEAAATRHGLPWRAHRLGGRSGYCLEPQLPRTAEDAARSLDARLIDARRLFMANRGIWEAIASAGPAVSFAHEAADVDAYLAVLDAFLEEVVAA